MQKGFGVLFIIIGIIALMLLGAGGFYVSKTIKLQPQNPAVTSQATSSPVPSASPAPNGAGETVNWKTYTNTQAGFQVKHPPSYQLIKEDSNSASFGYKDTVGNGPFEYLVITKNPFVDYQLLVACLNTTNNPDIVADRLPCLTENISDTNIDEIPAKSIYFTGGVDRNFHVIQTTSKPFIQVKMNVSGGGLERDFNQILSTFKFLDQSQTSKNNSDICSLISNFTFRSIDKHEDGLGPNGPVMGYWNIEFSKEGTFSWLHSDIVENGTYECKDNLRAIKTSNGKSISVSYDLTQGLLEWDGIKYKKVKEE